MATAAIAASAALPPDRNTSSAVSVAIGWEVAAIPFTAIAADRPGILKSRITEPFFVERCGPASGAFLTGNVPACPALMHSPNLPVNSPRGETSLMDGSLTPLQFPVAAPPPPGETL